MVRGLNVSSALLAYENLITLNDEVELVWKRKKTIASWLFLANRAILAVFIVDEVVEYAGSAVRRCRVGFAPCSPPLTHSFSCKHMLPSRARAAGKILTYGRRCMKSIPTSAIYVLLPVIVNAGTTSTYTQGRCPDSHVPSIFVHARVRRV